MSAVERNTIEIRPARPEDLAAVLGLVEHAELPTAGVAQWLMHFLVAERDGMLVGAAGLELYGEYALLRSVVVQSGIRGAGTGAALVEHALDAARLAGVREVILLTTTAEQWFPRFGFRRIERVDVPAAVAESEELRGACPATAAVFTRVL